MVTAFIPAKTCSTRLPGKNFRPLCGKSLVQRTIDWCREETLIDTIVLATDARVEFEGVQIWPLKEADITEQRSSFALSCEFARSLPPEEILASLLVTTPFRLHSEFRRAVQEIGQKGHDLCASVFDVHAPPAGDRSGSWNSQGREPTRFPTGSWRIGRAGAFAQYRQNHTPVDRVDWFSVHPVGMIDIDHPADWELAELVAASAANHSYQPTRRNSSLFLRHFAQFSLHVAGRLTVSTVRGRPV